MVKAFVFYDSKYGNTKLAGEKIAEGLGGGGVEVDLGYIKEVNPEHALDYDVMVLGAPNHMGRPSQTMKKFIDRLAEQNLKAKNVAVFGTYTGKEREDRAVKQMENMAAKKLHSQILISPGLSVRVNGIPGPIVKGELSKCVEFGKQIAAQIKNQTA